MEKKCLNCDFPILPEHKYCPSCSQRTSEKVTLRSLFANSIASYFSIDSRLLHTLLPILIKPGKVAKDFIAGKRKTYLYPVQSYLFFSLMFLLVFELLSLKEASLPGGENELINFNADSLSVDLDTFKLDSALINFNADSLSVDLDTFKLDSGLVNFSADSLSVDLDTFKLDSAANLSLKSFENKFNHFVNRLDSLKKSGLSIQRAISILTVNDSGTWKFIKSQIIKITYSGSNSFFEAFLGNTPFTLLFFLPFLALFQYLFGNKKKWNIASHFVFHLYNLSFAFIILLVLYIIDHFTGKNTVLYSLGIIPIYLFMALFRFYGSRVLRNILRFILLTFFSIVIGFPIIALGTFVLTFLRY